MMFWKMNDRRKKMLFWRKSGGSAGSRMSDWSRLPVLCGFDMKKKGHTFKRFSNEEVAMRIHACQ